ncbi:MAG: hypothetical protein A2Y82_00810 [Candidatus Buchananbacteria bacterium RBG_13_36_9]|uniref:Uncharacterized protein n=1 Tax=Candidatus Buchananbacteria bacterium RBG_13_36_9 TaxID=1797530 RepID=A0A1G1XNB1_9BACT|nr:MAG: hypothetical protein A2Y82_00810 [Candidatus Buchananbacteria bacterium RBG_13_36_9]
MIEISYSVFLIIYGLGLACFTIYAIFNLYHLFAFGFLNFISFLATFLFLAGTIIILFLTYQIGSQIDWTQTLIIPFP